MLCGLVKYIYNVLYRNICSYYILRVATSGGLKKMELIYKSESVIRAVSKNRPKSLIFRISRELYDILQFTHDTKVTVEVYVNDAGNKILKIYEKE